MYGLIGKITATPGKRADLISFLREGAGEMPGCLSYIVAEDAADPDTIWVTEIWENETSHKASLTLPAVQAAIGKARPHIVGFASIASTKPVAGLGSGDQAVNA